MHPFSHYDSQQISKIEVQLHKDCYVIVKKMFLTLDNVWSQAAGVTNIKQENSSIVKLFILL